MRQPRSSNCCAVEARTSVVKAYTNTLVSRNSSGIGFVPIELPVRRQRLAELADPCESAFAAAVAINPEHPLARHEHLDVVAFLQLQRLDYGGGKTQGQAV